MLPGSFRDSRRSRARRASAEIKDVIRLLRSEVNRAGGQAAWASKTGTNRIVVNKALNGRALPTKKIIKALKLRIVFVSELDRPEFK